MVEQWLLKFDPSQMTLTMFIFFVTAAVFLIIWKKILPYKINTEWPAKLEIQRMRATAEAKAKQDAIDETRLMREAVEKINITVGQGNTLLQQHDMTARAGIENLMDMLRVIMEKQGIDTSKLARSTDQNTLQVLAKALTTAAALPPVEGAASA